MNANRIGVGALVEWVVAAACIVAALAAGSLLYGEFRAVRAVTPVIAREAPAPVLAAPASIPPGAVSLPMLLLSDGLSVQLGETLEAVTERFTGAMSTQPPSAERAPHGERVTRFYEHRGTRFQLVFEPFERGGAPRLAAIYR